MSHLSVTDRHRFFQALLHFVETYREAWINTICVINCVYRKVYLVGKRENEAVAS